MNEIWEGDMMFSDSHCHLNNYPPETLADLIQEARAKGIDMMVSVGKDLESSANTIGLTQSYDGVLAAVGIHPWEAVPLTDRLRKDLYEIAHQGPVAAIGEIGLDYERSPETRDIQKELLLYQLGLARETGLPVNIHCREAHQDMMDILRQEVGPGLRGLVHGYTGDQEALKDWLDLGFYVSIGVRRFLTEEIPHLEAAVRQIPLDRLLTESDATGGEDSPRPLDLCLVAEKLATLRGVAVEEIADAATANLKTLLRV
jgi:TatD DNase family protein